MLTIMEISLTESQQVVTSFNWDQVPSCGVAVIRIPPLALHERRNFDHLLKARAKPCSCAG